MLSKPLEPTVTVLTSGGIDSAAVIDFYLRRQKKVECLHFQYSQANALSEKEAFQRIIESYGVQGNVINLGFAMKKRQEEVFCRNAILVLAASSIIQNPSRVALGIHRGSPYYDCTDAFVRECQRVLDGYFSGTVRLEAPFLEMTKGEIVSYCKNFKVPINLTYSCQKQNFPPCKVCSSCLDRQILLGE